jgi:hypothetical protein
MSLPVVSLGCQESDLRRVARFVGSLEAKAAIAGIKNSSRTRVAPSFIALRGSILPTGYLDSLRCQDARTTALSTCRIRSACSSSWLGAVTAVAGTPTRAPAGLLRYLIYSSPLCELPPDLGTRDPQKREKRRRLFAGDPAALADARRALCERGFVEHERCVFERRTSVDVYLETPELIVLVEGKERREGLQQRQSGCPCAIRCCETSMTFGTTRGPSGSSRSSSWKAHRRTSLSPRLGWQCAVVETIAVDAPEGSLPHRSAVERGEIANAFAGATTWQKVCRTFEIP